MASTMRCRSGRWQTSAAASRYAFFSPFHRDFLSHHEDAIGKVEKFVLVGPDYGQVTQFGKGALDIVDAVGAHLRYPVILGSRTRRVRALLLRIDSDPLQESPISVQVLGEQHKKAIR
jgi:hypothetical protein